MHTTQTPPKRNSRTHTPIQPYQMGGPDETCRKHTTTSDSDSVYEEKHLSKLRTKFNIAL